VEPDPVLLDARAVARRLGISVKHLTRLVDRNQFPPPVRLGRCCRWPRHVVDAWVRAPYGSRAGDEQEGGAR
jgi:predicted DNA-binding transcriptional regulator AlpA